MSNFNFNKVILGGRLTADPELKQTPSGIQVASFSIAVNRNRSKDADTQQADFINCVAWRNTAEFICSHFKKGSAICVTGSLQIRNWTDAQQQRRYVAEVVIDEAHFVDSKSESSAEYGAPAFATPREEATAAKFENLPSDDDLPF